MGNDCENYIEITSTNKNQEIRKKRKISTKAYWSMDFRFFWRQNLNKCVLVDGFSFLGGQNLNKCLLVDGFPFWGGSKEW